MVVALEIGHLYAHSGNDIKIQRNNFKMQFNEGKLS